MKKLLFILLFLPLLSYGQRTWSSLITSGDSLVEGDIYDTFYFFGLDTAEASAADRNKLVSFDLLDKHFVEQDGDTVAYLLNVDSVWVDEIVDKAGTGQPDFPNGVTFSGGPSILNSYEEAGTFTPVLEFGGATTGITYTTQTGRYWRVGEIVFIRAQILLSSKGSATGSATISGIPYTVQTLGGLEATLSIGYIANIAFTDQLLLVLDVTDEISLLTAASGAGITALDDVDFQNTSRIVFSGWYVTDQ